MASLTSVHNMARWVSRTPVLKTIVPAVAKKFTELSGYRDMGLRYVYPPFAIRAAQSCTNPPFL